MPKIGKLQKASQKIDKEKKTEPQKNKTNNGKFLLRFIPIHLYHLLFPFFPF